MRVLSGVQPTGALHIGNYLGALVQWRALQHEHDTYFCVVDLHSLTVPENVTAAGLREANRSVAALYVASGIDPEKATLFLQSEVRAHAELAWILTCVTPMGWLQRMTQFKDKSARGETVGAGLFTYPALMAADILLYDANLVPVGADQIQHIELTRDVAARFHNLYGEVFTIPDGMVPKEGARIMGLDDPTAKMSKSLAATQPGHAIGLLDTPKAIKKAINSAKTDSGLCTRLEDASPGIKNLLGMFAALTGESAAAIGERYDGRGYGYLKKDLIDAIEAELGPLRQRYAELRADDAMLDAILDQGAERANETAEKVLHRVRDAVGLGRARRR